MEQLQNRIAELERENQQLRDKSSPENSGSNISLLSGGFIPLDIKLFRDKKSIEKLRISQRRRYPVESDDPTTREKQLLKQTEHLKLIDDAIDYDIFWREERFKYDNAKAEKRKLTNSIRDIMRNKDLSNDEKTTQKNMVITRTKQYETKINKHETQGKKYEEFRNQTICQIGNVCPDDRGIAWTYNEDNSPIYKEFNIDQRLNVDDTSDETTFKSHVDLVEKLDIVSEALDISGSRSFFLKDLGCYLNQALINYGLQFLRDRKFKAMHCPFFIRQSVMGQCAQLEDFDEQLYKVSGEGEDKYLIATSEQALCCHFKDKFINKKDLPIQVAGYSSCFRKEVGNNGRELKGIFRVHQFEKVEQFCITEPDKSWEMMEEMLNNSMDFYKSLEIPFRVINVVSGDLNNAAAQKYDLEAWFPGSKAYRELVSCSNCLDYQSRRLQTKIKTVGSFVHMLNSTLTATERTICCILENYQTETGVKIPKVLIPYMPNNVDFIPFV